MMDRRKINVGLAAVVTTVAELGEAPEGVMYAGLITQGYALDEFETVLELLARSGMIKRAPSCLVTITDAGRAMARKIEAFAAVSR